MDSRLAPLSAISELSDWPPSATSPADKIRPLTEIAGIARRLRQGEGEHKEKANRQHWFPTWLDEQLGLRPA